MNYVDRSFINHWVPYTGISFWIYIVGISDTMNNKLCCMYSYDKQYIYNIFISDASVGSLICCLLYIFNGYRGLYNRFIKVI